MNAQRDAGPPQRLSALDVSNLRVEEHGMPMHVAALALLDGRRLLDASGALQLDMIRSVVEKATRRSPRLRDVLVSPTGGRGRPHWVADPDFDVARHVQTRELAAPADEATLLAACAELNEAPLDRARPLWEIWLLTGMPDDQVGLLVRFHHVLADGTAALGLFGPMFDLIPDPRPAPEPVPDHHTLGWPIEATKEAIDATRQVWRVAREGRAPRVSLNRPVGRHRQLTLIRTDLASTQAVASQHEATVNDVVLAAVAAGMRSMLARRGELVPGLVLKVSESVSLRDGGWPAAGNKVGVHVVPISVTEADLGHSVDAVAAVTRRLRSQPPYQPAGPLLQRWMVRGMGRQRLVHMLVSNLRGPSAQLHFAGAPVREIFAVGVVQGNLPLSVVVLSYASQLSFCIVSDPDAVADVGVFAEGMSVYLRRLTKSGVTVTPPPRPGKATSTGRS